jgi:hypothetical protein
MLLSGVGFILASEIINPINAFIRKLFHLSTTCTHSTARVEPNTDRKFSFLLTTTSCPARTQFAIVTNSCLSPSARASTTLFPGSLGCFEKQLQVSIHPTIQRLPRNPSQRSIAHLCSLMMRIQRLRGNCAAVDLDAEGLLLLALVRS